MSKLKDDQELNLLQPGDIIFKMYESGGIARHQIHRVTATQGVYWTSSGGVKREVKVKRTYRDDGVITQHPAPSEYGWESCYLKSTPALEARFRKQGIVTRVVKMTAQPELMKLSSETLKALIILIENDLHTGDPT